MAVPSAIQYNGQIYVKDDMYSDPRRHPYRIESPISLGKIQTVTPNGEMPGRNFQSNDPTALGKELLFDGSGIGDSEHCIFVNNEDDILYTYVEYLHNESSGCTPAIKYQDQLYRLDRQSPYLDFKELCQYYECQKLDFKISRCLPMATYDEVYDGVNGSSNYDFLVGADFYSISAVPEALFAEVWLNGEKYYLPFHHPPDRRFLQPLECIFQGRRYRYRGGVRSKIEDEFRPSPYLIQHTVPVTALPEKELSTNYRKLVGERIYSDPANDEEIMIPVESDRLGGGREYIVLIKE